MTVEEVYSACEKQPDGNKFLQSRLNEWKRKGLVKLVYELRAYPYPFHKVPKEDKVYFFWGDHIFPELLNKISEC
ncbi:MAG: hypothetical protein ACJ8AW_12810 [Rhodopila sp.]